MRILDPAQVGTIAFFLTLKADSGDAPQTLYRYADELWECVREMTEIQERVHANIQAAFRDIRDTKGQEKYKEMELKFLDLLNVLGIAVDSLQELSEGVEKLGRPSSLPRIVYKKS